MTARRRFLLFDIDGTLVHSQGAGSAALTLAFRRIFHEPDFEGIRIHGCTDRGIASEIFASHGIEDSTENWHRFRDEYLRHLPATLAARQGEVLAGVPELLEHLAALAHIELGILTGNTAGGAEQKLAHFGLGRYFTFGAYGDDHVDRADVARAALRALEERFDDVESTDVWIIGDTENDIRCGRAIGARVLAVATGATPMDELARHRPCLLLPNLRECGSWFRELV